MIKDIIKAIKKGQRVTYNGMALTYEKGFFILNSKNGHIVNPEFELEKISVEDGRNVRLQQYERYVTKNGRIAFVLGKDKYGRYNVVVTPNYYPTSYDEYGNALRKGPKASQYDIVRKL